MPVQTELVIYKKMMMRLSHFKEKGIESSLVELWQRYEKLAELENLEQIQKYDENCEVSEYEEGCVKTRVQKGRFDHFQSYIRDGLKYHALTEYYFNKGRYIAFELIQRNTLELRGANEDDRADSFDHICRQIAAKEFLEHYGVEENFTLNGK
ncbi:MAG TPA: hypothetical protein DCF44_00730 [Chitinophagaceae bacterium]|nr:hypothetical protein [Chitinophagaceae bacterium]